MGRNTRFPRTLSDLITPIVLIGLSWGPIAINNIEAAIATSSSSDNVVTQSSQHQQNENSTSEVQTWLSKNSNLQSMSATKMILGQQLENSGDDTTLSSSMLKTYIRINSMRVYHMDLHSYRKEAKYFGDPEFVDSHSSEHKLRCAKHLNSFKRLLDIFYTGDPMLDNMPLDALRLADTFGRPASGVLSGNQFWLGSYDSCLSFKHSLTGSVVSGERQSKSSNSPDGSVVNAQYCVAIAQFPNWNPQDSKTSIKIGMCLPETCTSSMLNENNHLFDTAEQMLRYSFSDSQPFRKLKLREIYCLPHKTSEIRKLSPSAICFLGLVGSIVMLSIVATTLDHWNSKSPIGEQDKKLITTNGSATGVPVDLSLSEVKARNWKVIVIESFSITRNLDKIIAIKDQKRTAKDESFELLSRRELDGDDDTFDKSGFFNCITGLKCIGLVWIICAHTLLVSPITSSNLIHLDQMLKTYMANVFLTAHLMVDTFFALSGLLASYLMFHSGIEKLNIKNWVIMIIHRYWRLTPIYVIIYWFTKSVGVLINSGPLWDYMTAESSPRLNCNRESWAEALLHMNDFKSPKDHCVPFAWFIANGIKFFILTPIFLVLIHKSMRKGYAFTILTILANMILVAILAVKSEVDVKAVIEFKPESADNMLNNMGQVYTRPYSRIGAYLIGLLAGHLIFMKETNQIDIKISKNSKIIIWTIFSIVVAGLTFLMKAVETIELNDSSMLTLFAFASAIIRPLWASCTCWLVFALAHGQVKWLARILSAKVWRVLVKLSFCAYLAQGEVMAQLYLSTWTSDVFTYTEMVTRPMVTTTLTLIVSVIMVLLLEYPLIGIEELILPKRNHSQQYKQISSVNHSSQQKLVIDNHVDQDVKPKSD